MRSMCTNYELRTMRSRSSTVLAVKKGEGHDRAFRYMLAAPSMYLDGWVVPRGFAVGCRSRRSMSSM